MSDTCYHFKIARVEARYLGDWLELEARAVSVCTDDVEPIASNVSVEHQHISQIIHMSSNTMKQHTKISFVFF